MSDYRVLRRDDHHEMPWLNGGGSTLQVATSPDGAGMADFDWRVSFARVEASGPFSRFEGVDRVITLVEGAGLRLTVDDGTGPRVVDLTPHEPFVFAGEDDVTCEVTGPSLDLNLMTRRGRCVGEARTERVGDFPLRVEAGPGEDVLVAVLDGEVLVAAGSTVPVPLTVPLRSTVPGRSTDPGASTLPTRLRPLDVVVDVREPLALTGDGVLVILRVSGAGGERHTALRTEEVT